MNDNQFDPESDYDQLGLLAHRAVTTQLHILAEQAGDDPQACYSLICGALVYCICPNGRALKERPTSSSGATS
jgi:hypothetical protein